MSELTKRFLESIKLEGSDLFDLELTQYKKSADGHWIYYFQKHSPWHFEGLELFLAHVEQYVGYQLEIVFSYSFAPKLEDALELFSSWFMRRHFIPCPFITCEEDDKLVFKFDSEENSNKYRATVEDFVLLLKTIHYPFEVEAKLLESETTKKTKKNLN